jgi:hypothetical protein
MLEAANDVSYFAACQKLLSCKLNISSAVGYKTFVLNHTSSIKSQKTIKPGGAGALSSPIASLWHGQTPTVGLYREGEHGEKIRFSFRK